MCGWGGVVWWCGVVVYAFACIHADNDIDSVLLINYLLNKIMPNKIKMNTIKNTIIIILTT